MVRAGGHGMEAVLAAEPPAALEPALAACVDAWLAAAVERSAPLTFSEIRRGVQALSQRYVERREPGDALGSAGKRAAFATYFAALHLATAFGAVRALPPAALSGVSRIVDLGAGSGAVGAAIALALAPASANLLALDRSGFALAEARRTYAAFGLCGDAQRVQLPAGIPRLARGDLAVAGWFLNECNDAARERVLAALERGLDAGARVLVLEPLSGRAVPWWDDAAARFAARGVAAGSLRWLMERPAWVAHMDKAARLDHRELGARIMFGRVLF
jgi:SAM-dependent methyltransferase